MTRIRLSALSPQPRVTVVVPSYNQGRYIRATLDSILAQDYRPLQILVIDGGSTDETLDVLREYAAHPELEWVSEPDRGPADAVNKGFDRARGEICAVQSSDDFYLPGALRRVVEEFQGDESLALLYGDAVKVAADGTEISRMRIPRFTMSALLARESFVLQPAAFFRIEAARQLGGWDESIPFVPDTDFWFRIAFRGRVRKVDAFLAACRAHPEQRDQQRLRIQQDYEKMIEGSVDLARAPILLRRAARAGVELLRLRYGTGVSRWELTRTAWRAVLLHPRSLLSPSLPKHLLVPGYFRAAGLLGVMRRALLS